MRKLLLLLACVAVADIACGTPEGAEAASPDVAPPVAEGTKPAPPVPPEPAPAPPGSVAVTHARELRGAWISVVWNGTWPSASNLTEAAAKTELVAILDGMAAAHMNVAFLQVRSESDAIYPSTLEPWSRFLTGKQGQDPGWDPLAFAIAEAHARGIELHAWVNPYRGLTSTSFTPASNHVTKTLSAHAVAWGSQVWMNPGAPAVRTHVENVVRDLVTRYDVDGLHFDDYFYPYPIDGQTFPDAALYASYQSSGGTLSKSDWRRSNVNALVERIATVVADERPDVRFGISPFGIYKPGTPEGVTGLDAYEVLSCDPVTWMNQGWIDYLVPQLYWSSTHSTRPFGKLATWWAGLAKEGRSVFAGHDLTQVKPGGWATTELDAQMALVRPSGLAGSVHFTAKPIADDTMGIRTLLASTYWTGPVSTPPLASTHGLVSTVALPEVSTTAGGVTLRVPAGTQARSFAIYRADGATPVLEQLVPAWSGSASVALDAGAWAVSVVDRRGVEGAGVPVTVP